MANWAIAIGINQYQFFQPLTYAQADAQALLDFLVQSAGFLANHCLLLTDTSPPIGGQSTYPNGENMLRLLDGLVGNQLQPGDQLWCFFSGYGVNYRGQDYLMPVEGNPNRVVETGLPVRSLYETLQTSAVETVLVLLDVNRASGAQTNTTIGQETLELAEELQIPTILSCSPDQFSRESTALGHGFFTAVLLEALRSGQCSTLAELERYLSHRLPQLCDHHSRPLQQPMTVIPASQTSYQLLPQLAMVGSAWNSRSVKRAVPIGSQNSQSVPLQVPLQVRPLATQTTAATPNQPQTAAGNSQSAAEPTISTLATSTMQTALPSPRRQQLFWWSAGSVLVLALILGVVLRHWTAFSGGQIALQSLHTVAKTVPVTPAIPDSQPQVPVTPAIPDSRPQQQTNQVLLAQARMSIRQNQATEFSRAIKTAHKIQNGQPLYQQAQQDIDRWSRVIFDLAEGRAQRGDYEGAIAAAALLTKEQAVYREAQTAIPRWRMAAKQQRSNETLVQAAAGLIRPDQASSYNRAIEVASKVPPSQPGSALAQQSIRQWSQTILALSQQRATGGRINDAIQTAVLVPEYTATYPKARQAIQKWQEQLKIQQ